MFKPLETPPRNPAELANEILSNLSNLAKIPTQYYDYDSGLKLLHSLAKFEYKTIIKPENAGPNPMELEFFSETTAENSSLNALKRHSSFSLDHYSKGVYKLRRFEKTSTLNLDLLSQNNIEKVDFNDLIPKSTDDVIEPHMTRLINLHCLLYKSLFEHGLQETGEIDKRDDILLKACQKNISTLLKTGSGWLNKELIRRNGDYSRYYQILDKILDLLNTRESIEQIVQNRNEDGILWVDFFKKILIFTKKVLLHMSLVCESLIALNVSYPMFLDIFKKTILNNLENKDFCFYGLDLFLNLINKEAFNIVDNHFWPIEEFQESIASSAERALDFIKTTENPELNKLSDTKIKDYTIKYLYLLWKKPGMIEKLVLSFAELAPVSQQVVLDKFAMLDKEGKLEYISVETLIKLFKFPKNHEKLLTKFIDKYCLDPSALQGFEDLLLPEINNFCLENGLSDKLITFMTMNSETEFYRLSTQLIILGMEGFFSEAVPLLLSTAPKLAQNLFLHIHEKDLSNDQNAMVVKIHEFFFKSENFFEKEVILEILKVIVERDNISSLIMRTVLKVFILFMKKKEEIFEDLEVIVGRLIDKNMMENDRIWTGMKKFFLSDKRSVNLLKRLPENFKKDFFKE